MQTFVNYNYSMNSPINFDSNWYMKMIFKSVLFAYSVKLYISHKMDTIFKVVHLKDIQVNFGWNWYSGFRGEDIWKKFMRMVYGQQCKVIAKVHMVLFGWFMVFKVTFKNISVIAWPAVLLVEETRVIWENDWPVASQWQTWSHNVVSSTPRHEQSSNSKRTWPEILLI